MSATTSLKENYFPGGHRKGEPSTPERSELLLLTPESYTVHRHFLTGLFPNVIEEASAAMEQILVMNDLQLDEKPVDVLKLLGTANPDTALAVNNDLEIDIEDEDKGFRKSSEGVEVLGSMKRDNQATGVLQRQKSLKGCGKLMDIVNSHSSPFLNFISKEKSFNERALESPSARWRKCKRSALFDSRRIVLFFSILYEFSPSNMFEKLINLYFDGQIQLWNIIVDLYDSQS